jgi:hypothetical protein
MYTREHNRIHTRAYIAFRRFYAIAPGLVSSRRAASSGNARVCSIGARLFE